MIGTYISPSFYQISDPVSAFVSVLYPAALLPVYVFGPSLPPLPSHPPMPQSTKTVVVLGASYAGKSKTSHLCRIYPTHAPSHLMQVTEQFTNLWKNFQRIGGSSSLKETRTYYSPIFCLLRTNLNALDTSTVSRVLFDSLSFDLGSQLNLSVIIDLYTLPRLAVLRGHEHKACE